jgi:curli biogenesis system outer membrane secretion channel CsgG
MYRQALLATFVAALAIAPAQAQESAGSTASKPAKEKKICKRSIATGSVMTKVTCRTKAEWDAMAAASQLDLDRTRDLERSRSLGVSNSGT